MQRSTPNPYQANRCVWYGDNRLSLCTKNERPRGQHRSGLLVIDVIIQRIYARLQTYSGENLTLPSFKLLNIIRNKDSVEFMDVIIS